MQTHRFGKTSQKRLVGVDTRLVRVVYAALRLNRGDFLVAEGVRSAARQQYLRATGKSQVMVSKHQSGQAVDLVPYYAGRAHWGDEEALFEIANSMKEAAQLEDLKLRWGGAWHIRDFAYWNDNVEETHRMYLVHCQKEGRKPFIDLYHFEIVD